MKESDCRFSGIKRAWCEECKREVLHETGINKVTKEKVKLCICCETITIIGKGVNRGKVN